MKITQEQIIELKQKYDEVFEVKVGKQTYYFRALTIAEYNEFTDLGISSGDLEDIIVERAILFPTNGLDYIQPGAITSLSNEILEESGFASIDKVKEELVLARDETGTIMEMMKCIILAAMPSYRYDQLEDYTLKQITKLVGIAESILEIQATVAAGEGITMSFVEKDAPQQQRQQPQPPVRPRADHTQVNPDDLELVRADPDASTKVGTAVAQDPIAAKLMAALR